MTGGGRLLGLLLVIPTVLGPGGLDLCGCGPDGHGPLCDAAPPSASASASCCAEPPRSPEPPAIAAGGCCGAPEPQTEPACCEGPGPAVEEATSGPRPDGVTHPHEECACPYLTWDAPLRSEPHDPGPASLALGPTGWLPGAGPSQLEPGAPPRRRPPNAPPDGVRLHLLLGVWIR